jgi:molybdenum cofactor guanylyltransferase
MTDRAKVTAIVLAGGRSSRFGGPKLQAIVDGRTLLDHSIDVASQLPGETVIATAPGMTEQPQRSGVRVVADPQPFEGPLAGLASALASVSTPLGIVIAGDMPRLSAAVLAAMLDALDDPDRPADAVVLADGETRRPLPLALRVEPAGSAVLALLDDGERSLRALVARLDARVLTEPEWRPLDPSGGSLVDIDRPDDLEALAERASDRDVREVR